VEHATLIGAMISGRRSFLPPVSVCVGSTPKITHTRPSLPAASIGEAVTKPPAPAIVRTGSKLRPPSVERAKPSLAFSSVDQTTLRTSGDPPPAGPIASQG
jgi:hypothetical protein